MVMSMLGMAWGLFKTAIMILVMIILYFLISYFLGRIARKKAPQVGMLGFFIPYYRYYKFIKVYNLPFALFIGLSFNIVTMILIFIMAIVTPAGDVISAMAWITKLCVLCYIVTVVSFGILWGRIAEAMGDKFWLWCLVGVLTAFVPILVFLVPLIFAFSNCMPGGTGVIAAGVASQPQPTVKRKPTQLYCPAGEYKGKAMTLKDGMKIGRDAEMDVVLGAPEISRHHATLSFSNGQLLLTDCSQNGTFVLKNGKKLRIVKDVILEAGDVFEMGSAPERFVVRL